MIKNRNIANDAGIDPSKIAGGTAFQDIRETFYVCPATAAPYQKLQNSVETGHLFTTIRNAVAAATNYSRVIVYPGDYDEAGVLNITKEGLQILGPGSDMQNQAMILGDTTTNILMTINASNVLITGLGFTQTKARSAIEVGSTAAAYKVTISSCRFDGWGTGTYAIFCNATQDAPDLVVENNTVRSFATAGIHMNATRSMCRDNVVFTAAGTIGIEHKPTGDDRAFGVIADNTIQGVNSTDTGIKLTGTPSAGAVTIARNYVLGCATTITQAVNNTYNSINNYKADGAGGSLIDTVL